MKKHYHPIYLSEEVISEEIELESKPKERVREMVDRTKLSLKDLVL